MCCNRNKPINDHPARESTNDRIVNCIFIGVMIVVCLIVSCGIWMFFNECRYDAKYAEWYDELIKKQEIMYSQIVPTDSILSTIIAVKAPQNSKAKETKPSSNVTRKEVEKYLIPLSEVLKIKESQKLLLIRQDQLIDDMRQETNNIINKMNGWLGFWMGAMAILGVFVPIALQFKLYKDNRYDADKLEKDFKDLSSSYEIVQRTAWADIKAELIKNEIKIDKRFNQIQSDYHRDIDKLQIVQFTARIRCFHNIMDSPEIRTNELRNQLLAQNWSEIVTKVKQFIDYYDNPTTTDVNSYVMSVMLLQVASVLTSLKILIPRRMRLLESLSDESYNIIYALNTVPLDKSSIIKRLSNYQESLSNLANVILSM